MLSRPVRSLLQFGAVAAGERHVSQHVPYLRHVDGQTVKTKDGMFVTCLEVAGFCFQTADQDEIDRRLKSRNDFVRALNDSRFAVYSHIIRRQTEAVSGGDFQNDICAEIDRRYMEDLRTRRMFVNDLHLTIVRRGFQGRVGLADMLGKRFRKGLGSRREEFEREAVEELREAAARCEKEFGSYGCRILKVVERPEGVFSETCEFLAQLLNGGGEIAVALPRMGLDGYLPTRRILFGRRAMEMRGAVDGDTRFGAIISLREYPPWTGAGMIDGLLKVPGEFIVSQSFSLQDRGPVLEEISKIERQISSSDEAGTEVESAIGTARNEVATGRSVMGHHHLTVLCLGRTLKEMEFCTGEVVKEATRSGALFVREDLNAEAAFWAQMPGNFSYVARKSLISSANFMGFASLHNFATGQRAGNHWGPAVSAMQSTSQTPYYFNFHRRDVGHFTVVGPTGSGKTVFLSFILSQAMRISPQPRCVFFDKDRGADAFFRGIGGRYEALVPGEKTGFNPLQLDGTDSDRTFLSQLLRFLVRPSDGRNLKAHEGKIVNAAVDQIFNIPKLERRFRDVKDLLRGAERAGHEDLSSRFERWTGEKGWLFDNDVDQWDGGAGLIGFDITRILEDDDLRTAALGYIFHRVESLLDGTPMLVFIDEGWRVLKDDKFSSFVNDKLKTIRKKNGIVGFGTQSAKDIVGSLMSHTLLEQTRTNIFFPNVKADEESYIGGFKLSRREFEWVRSTSPEARQCLIKHDLDSVVVSLDLAGMPDLVKLMSGTGTSWRECEKLRAKHGDDPRGWVPYFCGWVKEEAGDED